jgi:gamma-glutamylputrescine oxidase
MQLSFWERNTWFRDIDVTIIGSGIVGLSAAIALKEKDKHLRILVVDAGFLPYGASTRNAGFACFGSLSELIDDLRIMKESEVIQLVSRRWNGLKKLRSILKDPHIGYEGYGGYEVFTAAEKESYQSCLNKMEYFNSVLFEITGIRNIYSMCDEKMELFGFKNTEHLILNSGEGQIDVGKMMEALLHKARQHHINVLNGIDISSFHPENDKVVLESKQGFSFTSKKLLITTNGFAKRLLPELDVEPARAQVLITEPIQHLKIKGCFHYDKGFYYFRNVGNRVLFGGGRNLDFKKEATDEFGTTEVIQNKLDELLSTVILPNVQYKVELRWSGIMGLGTSKSTIIKEVQNNIYCAVRMGGMGIAIGSLVGEDAAELVLKNGMN